MEKFKPFDNQKFENELKNKLNKVYQSALPLEIYEQKVKDLRVLRFERAQKGLNTSEENKYQVLEKEVADSEIVVSNLYEYKKLLEIMNFPKEYIAETLNHENAHANVAEQLPSQKLMGYRIRFYKDKNGRILLQPSVKVLSYMDFPEKTLLEHAILVSEAPAHYGDELSESDKDEIKRFKEKLDILNKNENK